MSYRIVKFGLVDLPELDPEDDLSTHEARSRLVLTPGGWFDAAGSGRAGVGPLRLSVRRALISEGTFPDNFYNNRTEFNELRALIDTRDKLWRAWATSTGYSYEWTWARLQQVISRADRKDNRNLAELELVFQVESPAWYTTDETTYTNPFGFMLLANQGNAPLYDITFTIAAGLDPVTAISITNSTTGHALAWAGTLTPGASLVIACGVKRITNGGVAAYNELTEPTTERWMEFAVGWNSLTAAITGGDGSEQLVTTYSMAWR
jgi:hypothetical protein